jgi:molybdate transport system substrate-binding protein
MRAIGSAAKDSRGWVVAAALALLVLAAGCGRVPKPQPTAPAPPPQTSAPRAAGQEVVLDVFVPCAFAEASAKISALFEQASPGVRVNRTVENVGVLLPRILKGAKPDVFMSVGDREIETLSAKGMVEERRDFCFTTLVLVVPRANPARIQSLEDLAKPQVKTLALGDSQLSVGYYAEKILREQGLWEKVQKKIVRPRFPIELMKLAAQGKAQATIAYGACFRSKEHEKKLEAASLELITDFLDKYCLAVACPAAIIKGAAHVQEAHRFLEFLTRPECQQILADAGFLKLSDPKCFPQKAPAGRQGA